MIPTIFAHKLAAVLGDLNIHCPGLVFADSASTMQARQRLPEEYKALDDALKIAAESPVRAPVALRRANFTFLAGLKPLPLIAIRAGQQFQPIPRKSKRRAATTR